MKRLYFLGILLGLILCGTLGCGTQSLERLNEKGINVICSKQTNSAKAQIDRINEFFKYMDNAPVSFEVLYLNGEEEYQGPCDGENLVLSGYLDFDDFHNLLMAAYGNGIDYGLGYGMTELICKELNLCASEHNSDIGTIDIKGDNLFLLDFNRPILDGYYVNEEESAEAKALAEAFCEYIYDRYGYEKLEKLIIHKAYEEEMTELKNEWLRSVGVTDVYVPIAPYDFRENSNGYREEYTFYIIEDGYKMFFKNDDVTSIGYNDFFSGYEPVHELAASDFREARKKFWKKTLLRTEDSVDIYTDFTETDCETYEAQYYNGENRIKIYDNWMTALKSLLHEYIHYLDDNSDSMSWEEIYSAIRETYTEEFIVYECTNHMRQYAYKKDNGDSEIVKTIGLYNEENDFYDICLINELETALFYKKVVPEWISVSNDKQRAELFDVVFYSDMPYSAAASFYRFLIDKYGEDTVHSASTEALEFANLFGGEYNSVYYEWGENLLNNYGGKLKILLGENVY